VTAVVDCDSHLFEPPGLWQRYADPADRHRALRLADDELGWTWLTHGDRQVHPAFVHRPGDVEDFGEQRRRQEAGQPPTMSYADALPRDFESPAARLDTLDAQGIAEAVVFPNFGLLWERPLQADLPATLANMAAWNRYTADVIAESGGRLHPVAHVSLRDLDWLEDQLAALSAAGVRLAMTAPALVDGKPLSHPDLDRAWSSFEAHGIAPVFHVAASPFPFDEGWYADDPDYVNPVLSSVFLHEAAALSLADLALHGVFARHPDLRLGVVELSALWFPTFLLMLDGGADFYARSHGRPLVELADRPSEYLRRQVRLAAFAHELPHKLAQHAGELFMACSDYPHAEGTADPLAHYRNCCGTAGDPVQAPALFAGNVNWLLGR
jgi:predicted TIM-barrel fold metal-dependent hydrolase